MEMDISLPKAGIFVAIYFDESSTGFFSNYLSEFQKLNLSEKNTNLKL